MNGELGSGARGGSAAGPRPAPEAEPASGSAPWQDAVVALVLVAIAGWVWLEVGDYSQVEDPARDPAVMPQVIACLLAACALIIGGRALVVWLRGRRSAPARGGAAGPGWRALGAVALTLAGVFAYIWGAFELGYVVSTAAFLAIAGLALTGRTTPARIGVMLLVAIVGAVVVWFGFVHLLGVLLPPTWTL